MAAEEERGVELRGLLSDFEEAIKDKQGVISEEQQLLVQMTTVRDQVKEESIKYQFADVMAKKADLISIEVILLEDMVDCREQLVQELEDTLAREKTISGVIEALPSLGDKVSRASYHSLHHHSFSSFSPCRPLPEPTTLRTSKPCRACCSKTWNRWLPATRRLPISAESLTRP
jgi:hypothetical protein